MASNKSLKKRRQEQARIAAAERRRLIEQGLPPQNLIEGVGVGLAFSRTTSYSGPIPPPAMLKEYDDAVPGAASRILDLAERQADHRMDLEKKVLTSGRRYLLQNKTQVVRN